MVCVCKNFVNSVEKMAGVMLYKDIKFKTYCPRFPDCDIINLMSDRMLFIGKRRFVDFCLRTCTDYGTDRCMEMANRDHKRILRGEIDILFEDQTKEKFKGL